MEESIIAKRLYDDRFKNEVIGLVGSKKTIYNTLRETYFPFIDMKVNKTDDEFTDEVVLDFYELGSVRFNFRFTKSASSDDAHRLSEIKHISTETLDGMPKSKKIKDTIVQNMFRTRILYSVCMKGMLKSVIRDKLFPYADVRFTEIDDTNSYLILQFGDFRPIKFDLQFEPRNNQCYLLKKIN